MRTAGRVPEIVSNVFGLSLKQPDWTTGRLWLLRLGLFKLTRPKTVADDWAWLVDHSVQVGTTKCLLIVGIRLSELPPEGEPLRHEDLEPIEILPVERSTKEIVCEQLESAAAKTGVPRVIVDDHGADLHGGVTLFRERHPQTLEVYDLTHKAARLLKRRLERDERWTNFSSRMGQVKRHVQQTELACLTPPPLGGKARFMNLAPVVRWGEETLRLLDQPPAELLRQVSVERLEEKFGWLRDFRAPLREWSQYMSVIETALDFVREEGLTPGCDQSLREMLGALCLDDPARTLATELSAFVQGQSGQVALGERLPGSTEVLESCFGKFKALEQHQSLSGFTGLVLSLGALVSRTTGDVVKQAMATVRTKDVWNWCRNILGPTVQSNRKLAYHSETKPG